jgi:hypothetical protein
VTLPPGGKVPRPSEAWDTPDIAAGMKLIDFLHGQMFVNQIDAIDVSNYHGRRDPHQAQLLLYTIWPSAANPASPRVIQWGRPLGEEKFFDVTAAAKLITLNKIYLKYHQIDAGADVVDIHTEQVWIPASSPREGSGTPGAPHG